MSYKCVFSQCFDPSKHGSRGDNVRKHNCQTIFSGQGFHVLPCSSIASCYPLLTPTERIQVRTQSTRNDRHRKNHRIR